MLTDFIANIYVDTEAKPEEGVITTSIPINATVVNTYETDL